MLNPYELWLTASPGAVPEGTQPPAGYLCGANLQAHLHPLVTGGAPDLPGVLGGLRQTGEHKFAHELDLTPNSDAEHPVQVVRLCGRVD